MRENGVVSPDNSRSINMGRFPRFTVKESRASEPGEVLGSVSTIRHGRETWVGDGWIGYLMCGAALIPGRWRYRPRLWARRWAFVPASIDHVDAIRSRHQWSILDGYWGERAELVLDEDREWHRAKFEPTDAIAFREGGGLVMKQKTGPDSEGGQVIEGGWDHEHCAICTGKLGTGGEAEGYLSPPCTWVCERCYVQFVRTRSLDFIENG